MEENKSRPGVMLYFSDYETLKTLDPGQRIAIIDAYMEYAKTGAKPVFTDSMLNMLWAFGDFERKADQDAARYEKRRTAAVNAISKRWHKDEPKQQVDVSALMELEKSL